jgi:hypothetical protein
VNDELTRTVVAGLLGGGISGAIIGGLVTLWGQARTFGREDRYRFNEIKREKYAAFYVAVEEWLRAINLHYLVLARNKGRPKRRTGLIGEEHVLPDTVVAAGDPAPLMRLGQEVRLLGNDSVEAAVQGILMAVERWDQFRLTMIAKGDEVIADEEPAVDPILVELLGDMGLLWRYFRAARIDLGTSRKRRVLGWR